MTLLHDSLFQLFNAYTHFKQRYLEGALAASGAEIRVLGARAASRAEIIVELTYRYTYEEG